MSNLFAGQEGAPYHLSVGAAVINDKGEVCCRHHQTDEHNRPVDGYVLMRETIEGGESLEIAVERGLKEEFRVKASMRDFLGPVISHYGFKDYQIEKTTLFFLCDFQSYVEGSVSGFETDGKLEWRDIDFLTEKNIAQAKHLGRDDIDDSIALERAKQLIKGGK